MKCFTFENFTSKKYMNDSYLDFLTPSNANSFVIDYRFTVQALVYLQAHVLSQLSHRNIIQFFGAVMSEPDFCLVTGKPKLINARVRLSMPKLFFFQNSLRTARFTHTCKFLEINWTSRIFCNGQKRLR